MTQEISEALGMKAASNHFDDLEAIKLADHIGQEAPKFLLMLVLSPVARNAAAARGSGWSPSNRSDPTPLGRYRAAKVFDDGFVSPADDDGAIYPYPDKADLLRLWLCLVLPLVGGCHRSILWLRRVGRRLG